MSEQFVGHSDEDYILVEVKFLRNRVTIVRTDLLNNYSNESLIQHNKQIDNWDKYNFLHHSLPFVLDAHMFDKLNYLKSLVIDLMLLFFTYHFHHQWFYSSLP